MKKILILAALICLLVELKVLAQSQDPPRYELAAEFTTLNREKYNGVRVEPGVGPRFTFNFNKNFAAEVAMHVSFNDECVACINNGHYLDLFAGVKAGKRFKSWGIFAKARPGVMSFTEGQYNVIQTGTTGPFPFEIRSKEVESFAADLGGVIEFYPSRRIVTRFDAGDTVIHFTRRTNNGLGFDPTTSAYNIVPFTTPARTTHNFQFMASVGFRF